MAVPDYQSMMRPVLAVLADHGALHRRVVADRVADYLDLTDEDRTAALPSGHMLVRNRVGWAITYLNQGGALQRPSRGVYDITDRGRKLLADSKTAVATADLEQFREFQEFRLRSKGSPGQGAEARAAIESHASIDVLSPREQIDLAVAEANAAVEADLLSRIIAEPPDFLERLVLRLLLAMGYGERVDSAAEHKGGPGDEGIDGVIRQDPLGLDHVYLQAKRYTDRTVGRPEVQAFVGALHGAHASRGVFITTSTFATNAIQYASRVADRRVILIDGPTLASYLIRFGVGVQPEFTATLFRVDEDFFDSL